MRGSSTSSSISTGSARHAQGMQKLQNWLLQRLLLKRRLLQEGLLQKRQLNQARSERTQRRHKERLIKELGKQKIKQIAERGSRQGRIPSGQKRNSDE